MRVAGTAGGGGTGGRRERNRAYGLAAAAGADGHGCGCSRTYGLATEARDERRGRSGITGRMA